MRRRITFSVVLSIFAILIALGIISYLSVHDSIQRSLQSRLTLANIIGKYFDYILETNLTRLYDISISGKIDFRNNDRETEKKALKTAYEYSIFTDRIFLTDLQGNVMMTYPHQEGGTVNLLNIPYVSKTLSEGKPVISDVYTIEPTQRKVIFALVPLKSKEGTIIGIAGGEINPTSYIFTQVIKSIYAGPSTNIELVDSHGTIIASNDPKRILTSSDHNRFLGNLITQKKSSVGTCHRCHSEEAPHATRTNDMLAFAPLSIAPWGISVREPQEIVFSPSATLRRGFFILSVVSVITALLLGIGLSRGIVRPVQSLITATQRIAKGDLSEPVTVSSRDEIGILAKSFDIMRMRLSASLESIRRHNIELEHRVRERTQQIRQSRQKVESLLKKVISSQEEERKRIARGLHDEILQDLSAFLIKLDICKLYPEQLTTEKMEEMRAIALKSLDDIHHVIQNLRPSVLDDLGLGAAVKWLLDKNLSERGIQYYLTTDAEMDERFDPRVEITLFRIIQEAIINIARHAKAENVIVVLRTQDHSVCVDIEDDGEGFDVHSMLRYTSDGGRGLGLLGMKERISLLDGKLEICSAPGSGTKISVRVPLGSPLEGENV
ncbi:MAG TPA: HAMP domain-containing protein [Thermodesulfovibrionales bacterium]|nr:HAMP domain-containing protein [Thermodesulfovibrionales bacterium]